DEAKQPNPRLILFGLIIFGIGLFKKTVLADGIQPLVALAFHQAAPSFDQAWIGALAYTFQLYFDFSVYSDMAIGISLMFGIFLPLNFNSPYKATSIIDFWRRWHMSLSQFLRDYLYFRLGGNRDGAARRYANLMATMLLGGLWHGASWTFVVWGGLHGTYLLMNHAWRAAAAGLPRPSAPLAALGKFAGCALTFLAVVIAWVSFRATTFDGAARVLQGMFSRTTPCSGGCFDEIFRGILIPPTSFGYLGGFFLVGFALVWLTPTSQDTTQRMRNIEGRTAWLIAGALLFCVSLFAVINASHQRSEFI